MLREAHRPMVSMDCGRGWVERQILGSFQARKDDSGVRIRRPFFPKPAYILPGDQLPYPTRVYGPRVYDKLIAKGFNLIVTNLFPVWNWTTHQVKPANGPADINLMLWHQRGNYRSEDRDETPDTRIYDTDRMNLFTWKRIEDHIGYLARRGIVTWGFQGFAVKRSFGIRPQHFPDDKGRWYMRYAMARLAPYWNVIWHHTWESSEGADKFRKWVGEYDPWRHLYFQVDSAHPRYDIAAHDGKPDDMPRYYQAGRPIWMTEDNGPLWGYHRYRTGRNTDAAMDKAWSLVMQGATAYWTEWAGRRRFDDVATADVVDRMAILYNFIGDETDFATLRPHRELVDGGAYALANPGHQYVVYKPGGGRFAVRLKMGAYSVIWLDPHDGRRRDAGTIRGGGNVSFTTPATRSFALFLKAR